MKNGYTCGLCPGKIEWIQQYSFLVLLLLLSQPCTCSLVLLGQTLRKVIATGTELAPSFLLFLSPDWSLWFSWETQRHTCTKLSACQQTELPWPSPTSVSDEFWGGTASQGLRSSNSWQEWQIQPGKHLLFPISLCFFPRSNFPLESAHATRHATS